MSIDICLWSSNNRPAHRRARTACRLTDALSDQTDCVSIDKVKPCCSVTVPYQVPYLQDHVEPIMYKSKCLRKMYFHYTCYSHKTTLVA